MKKTLLFVFTLVVASVGAQAQRLDLFQNLQIQKMSNDAKMLVATDYTRTFVAFDYDTEQFTVIESTYNEELDYYSPSVSIGFGRAFDNKNRMVGSYDECTPAIYDHGEWIMLPIDDEVHKAGRVNQADDITPDGKRICGGIAQHGFGLDDAIMLSPVIWDQNPDGSYGMYKVLPHPEKDFTGRVPQYVTARCISEDGKTIIGQVMDYSGFWPMPIVYREDANGEWSYELIGEDLVYNKETVWPEWPVEPTEVDPRDYMTDEEKAIYEQALIDHDAAVDAYWMAMWSGEDPGEYPADVVPADYIADPTQFLADYEAYQNAMNEFYAAQNLFFDALYDPNNVYGPTFEFNDVFMSPDGKYYASTLITEGEPAPGSWFPVSNLTPIRFDLTNNSYAMSTNNNALPTAVLADGTTLCASPANDYARDVTLWPIEGEEETLLAYLERTCPDAATLVKENMTYALAEYDENWEVVPGAEVTMTGTSVASTDGNIFGGWIYNNYYDAGNWMVMGYVLDLGNATAISKTDMGTAKVQGYTVTSINGAVLYRGNNIVDARNAMVKGVNLLTTTMSDGSLSTIKVNKK